MTIAHSVLSISFGRKAGRTSASRAGPASAAPATCEAPGGMTCSPWEGLYLHTAESEKREEATAPTRNSSVSCPVLCSANRPPQRVHPVRAPWAAAGSGRA